MSRNQRSGFAAVAVLIAIIAVSVLSRGGDDDAETVTATATATATGTAEATGTPTPEPTPEPIVVRFQNGEVVGGTKEIEAEQGDTVRFTVESDVADEVHLHGYDISKPVAAGGRARFTFKAEITGIFEAELEGSAVPVAELKVSPG